MSASKKHKIVRVKNIRFSPAMKYVPDALQELWKDKTPDELIGCSVTGMYDEAAILIMVGKEVAAFLAYYLYSNDSGISTTMAYVRPEYRRKGLHAKLFNELKKIAIEKEIVLIVSGTDSNNEASIQSQLKQGRILTGHNFIYVSQKVPWS